MMSKVCLVVLADKGFHGYAPLWAWAARQAWPEYDLWFFYLGSIDPDLRAAVISSQCIAQTFPTISGFPDVARMAAGVRWFIFSDAYFPALYDAIYITDIDIVMTPEKDDLATQHLAHCKTLGLPYSNLVRAGPVPVLTGLHFATREYMKKVRNVALDYERRVVEHGWDVLDRLQL